MFGENIKFIYTWRSYQERVLTEIEKHLSDNKLHVIAPPGSGKTVLGLEVVRQLNKPTLILSPTITIRNQWINRFVELFANNNFTDISYSLDKPKYLTSSTYQSLYSAYIRSALSDEETDDEILIGKEEQNTNFDLIKTLKENKIKVLVLDEAHHLKRSWWKSLTEVVKELKDITIISLTATPPFDSTRFEWERYLSLCGPIDAEITVPELVKEKNLCPHQDLIYFSNPTVEESELLNEFYTKIFEYVDSVVRGDLFERLVCETPAVTNPEEHQDLIFNDVEYYAALIIFLFYKKNDNYKKLQKILVMDSKNIPIMTNEWLEYMFSFALFKDSFLMDNNEVKAIRKKLKELGAIEKKKVVIEKKDSFNKLMQSSLSKFNSIRDIVDHEYEGLGNELRLVVLTDYVRREVLNEKSDINKFGVIPIFKYLHNSNSASLFDYSHKMVILSGSICILPNSTRDSFIKIAGTFNLTEKEITFSPLPLYGNYSEVFISSSKKNLVVSIITVLFSNGIVNIIIGTKSLLGEGWDCPAINSLVMATFVGSYMFSNQMRGRAIRTNINNPRKTSNIWHLMCLDLHNPNNNSDYQLLSHRFKCFTGLDFEEDIITNGIERLRLPDFKKKSFSIDALNENIKEQGYNRQKLFDRWFNSINQCKNGRIVKEFKSGKDVITGNFVFARTIKFLFIQGMGTGSIYAVNFFKGVFSGQNGNVSYEYISNILSASIAVFLIFALPSTLKSILLLFKHGSVSSRFKQIARTVFETMKELEMFESPDSITIESEIDNWGVISSNIKNCSSYEQSIYLAALSEVVGQIKNPRYLVTREQHFILNTSDFHSVPSAFGDKKDKAEIFYKQWTRYMGKSQLFYTRNKEGRPVLIKARSNSLSSHFLERSQMVDSWKN